LSPLPAYPKKKKKTEDEDKDDKDPKKDGDHASNEKMELDGTALKDGKDANSKKGKRPLGKNGKPLPGKGKKGVQ